VGDNNVSSGDHIADLTHFSLHGVERHPQGGEHGRPSYVRSNVNAAGTDDVHSGIPVYSLSVTGVGRYGLDTIRTHME
jgi:hypothetical protein